MKLPSLPKDKLLLSASFHLQFKRTSSREEHKTISASSQHFFTPHQHIGSEQSDSVGLIKNISPLL
jgi:hypothetical protein